MDNKKSLINKVITTLIYVYMMMPVMIFALGFLKWYWGIPVTLACLVALWAAVRNDDSLDFKGLFKGSCGKVAAIVVMIGIWVFLSGIGGFCYQNSDHGARTAVFRALVSYDWPVVSNDGSRGLIYYLGFWLPSAIAGKLFGFDFGYWFQALWACIGIFIVYMLICVWRKKVEIWPLFVVIFFSGLDYLGIWLLDLDGLNLLDPVHLEWWEVDFQYSAMTTQLFWVFNQALPAWIATMMIFMQKKNSNLYFILSLIILTSTLPFAGLIPVAVFYTVYNVVKDKRSFKNIFSVQNLIGVFIIGIISVIYLFGNISAGKIAQDSIASAEDTMDISACILKYMLFYLFEFGIYAIIIYKKQKKNPLYYVVLAVLFVCPFIKVGVGHDFCMRASIPALFILMLLCIQTLEDSIEKKEKYLFRVLVIALCIGAITPFNEIHRSVKNTIELSEQGIPTSYPESDIESELLYGGNFSGETENNLFYRYFARQAHGEKE